jgi:hypothetical protein
MTDVETLVWTPEQAARYHDRFLPGAPPVTVEALRRHAAAHGGYLIAETAWDYGLVAPVPPEDPPSQGSLLKRKRRRR